MLFIHKQIFIYTVALVASCHLYGQVYDEFAPSINAAKKLKFIIKQDSLFVPKIPVKYTFFSFPFPSSFKPNKGDVIPLENTFLPAKLYNSSISFGYGSYSSPMIKGYGLVKFSKKHTIKIKIHHNSSKNSIPNAVLGNDYLNSKIHLTDILNTKSYRLESFGSFLLKEFNWYGLPSIINLSKNQIEAIDEKQTLYKIQLGSLFTSTKKYVKKISALTNLTLDRLGNKEASFLIDLNSDLSINKQTISVESKLYYTHSQLDLSDNATSNNFMISSMPYIISKKKNIFVKAGVVIFFNNQATDRSQTFNIYPTLYASYKLLSDYMISYGGVNGKQIQNTYTKFLSENNFINPRVKLLPTSENLRLFFGAKGRILTSLSYDIQGFALFENQKPLFKLHGVKPSNLGFDYGNSFDVVYDDMTTFKGLSKISWAIGNYIDINWNTSFAFYNTKNEAEAWNMPSFESHLFLNYNFNDKIYINASAFYIGSRYDMLTDLRNGNSSSSKIKTAQYTDTNLHLEYHIFNHISSFFEVNNILGRNYKFITNYKTQGRQLMLGATYKF